MKIDNRQFVIDILDLYWINGNKDDPEDRCLHGNVYVKIGNEIVAENYACTVSSTAIYLLKSLQEDHLPDESANQILPCCGFFIILHDIDDTVEITGCPNGIDWSILHVEDYIKLVTVNGTEVIIEQTYIEKSYLALQIKFKNFIQSVRKRKCQPMILIIKGI